MKCEKELTARQLGFLRWLSLARSHKVHVSYSWQETAAELERLGLITVLGRMASLTTDGISHLQGLSGVAHA